MESLVFTFGELLRSVNIGRTQPALIIIPIHENCVD